MCFVSTKNSSMDGLPGKEDYVIYRNPKQVFEGPIQPARILHNGTHIQCSISTLESGQTINRESHPQDQAILVINGSLAVQDASGVHEVHEGQMAIIPGNLQHKVAHRGAGTVKSITFYSPKAHDGETYDWPEEDEPMKPMALKEDQRVYVFDPIRALLSHKEAFQTDVVCTSHMSIGIATILNSNAYSNSDAFHATMWNREGFYFVLSGAGMLRVGDAKQPVSTNDLVYCAGLESEEPDYRFKASKSGASNVHSNALYLVYCTNTSHKSQLRPPLACWRADSVESVEPADQSTIIHADTIPSPVMVEVYAEEKPIPRDISSSRHNNLLEQIRQGKVLRRVEETAVEKNTNILEDQIRNAINARRQLIEDD